ncbi:MAG: prepilin peptidase [Eubacteriales bacterium]
MYILSAVYGLCVGSFLNVVIYRLPRGMNLAKPGSHCTSCGYELRWYDNIPVISYILLGGKCRKCKQHISFRYTAVELLNTALWLLCAWCFWEKSILYAVAAMLACSLFICIGFIDLETMYINDILVYLLGIPAIMAMISGVNGGVIDRIIGAVAGGGSFLIIYLLAKLILKKEGLGTGDVLLMAFSGAFLGWRATILTILIASVLGTVVLLPGQILGKREKGTEYPFGPFLALGAVLAMFVTEPLLSWYLGLFRL